MQEDGGIRNELRHTITRNTTEGARIMALIDSFTGRASPVTCKPVHVLLWRLFNPKTLQDVYKVEFVSGSKHEIYDQLTYAQAMSKYQAAKRWWS